MKLPREIEEKFERVLRLLLNHGYAETADLVRDIRDHCCVPTEELRTPEGWSLLPPEPTRAMLNAFHDAGLGVYQNRPSTLWNGLHYSDSEARYVAAYQAMLKSAPNGGAKNRGAVNQQGCSRSETSVATERTDCLAPTSVPPSPQRVSSG